MDSPLLVAPELKEEGQRGLREATWREVKMVWCIAGPVIITSVLEYALGSVTQALVGHVGTVELAAFGVHNLIISGIAFGIMLGMGSALETLCGQAYGAGKQSMMGIYMQRSWVILLSTASLLSVAYVFATPILKLLGQSDEIAELAGRFSIWMIPELFAFAFSFPIQRFLQAQSKVFAMAWMSVVVLVLHLFTSWLFIIKLGMGLPGAALSLNLSWWITVIGQFAYVLIGSFRDSWTGFSWLAFRELGSFLRLSLASAVMLCLEYWTLMLIILLAGLLKNPELAVDAATICMNVQGLCFMIPLGLLAAISVRISNELGAGRPKAAKFSILVVIVMSIILQTTVMIAILLTRNKFPIIFTDDDLVRDKVSKIALLLATSVLLSSIQTILSGVAIGAGWQATVAYVNLGCYYLVGLGTSVFLGFKLNLGLEGIWGGMLVGILVQTIFLIVITWKTDWNKEVTLASQRIATQGSQQVAP